MSKSTLGHPFKLPTVALFLCLLLTATYITPTTASDTQSATHAATATCPAGGIIYVKEGGAGNQDGTSWSNAFPYLQQALAIADNCEIWVAQGTYQPNEGNEGLIIATNSSRASKTQFSLKNNVALYGGFSGNETRLSERDWKNNTVTLIHPFDYYIPGLVSGRSVNSSAILDGFIIEGHGRSLGPGIYLIDSSPTLSNLIIRGFRNSKRFFGGPGILNSYSHPIINNVTITNNHGYIGGGISNSRSNPIITNSKIINNYATQGGGGIANRDGSDSILINVDITNNISGWGGGVNNQRSSPTLINVDIRHNQTYLENGAAHGGGVNNTINSEPIFINVNISENNSWYGAGMYNRESNPIIINTNILNNQASRHVGGIANLNGSNVTITNSLVWNNRADQESFDIFNPQIWNDPCLPNSQDYCNFEEESTAQIKYSLIQGSGGSSAWKAQMGLDLGNNIDETPLFGTLFRYSPVIDAGTNSVADLPNTDLAGNPRMQNGRIDIGAYELPDKPTPNDEHYITLDGQAITVAAPGVLENDMMRHDVTLAVYSPPANGQLTALNDDGSFTYQPNIGYCGADSFIYELRDTFDQIGLGTVTISMDCSPAVAPIARDDGYTTVKNAPYSATPTGFLENDSVTGTVSISIFSPPANGELLLFEDDGSFIYVPDEDSCYADSFIYEIKNLHGQSDLGTVTMTMDCSPQLDEKVYIPIVIR